VKNRLRTALENVKACVDADLRSCGDSDEPVYDERDAAPFVGVLAELISAVVESAKGTRQAVYPCVGQRRCLRWTPSASCRESRTQ